jgi:hypothetical protein
MGHDIACARAFWDLQEPREDADLQDFDREGVVPHGRVRLLDIELCALLIGPDYPDRMLALWWKAMIPRH